MSLTQPAQLDAQQLPVAAAPPLTASVWPEFENPAAWIVAVIREQHKEGSTFVKMYETGPDSLVNGEFHSPYQFTEAQLKAGVDEAARLGTNVGVHAQGEPGTLYLLEPDLDVPAPGLEGHSMNPMAVLGMVRAMGGTFGIVRIVGCEPGPIDLDAETEPALGLAVQSAIDGAVALIETLIHDHLESSSLTRSSHE